MILLLSACSNLKSSNMQSRRELFKGEIKIIYSFVSGSTNVIKAFCLLT